MTRILIVEDDPAILSLLGDVLTSEGYCVETAENGRVAMEMVARAMPDLLITDLLLPGLTGWSVLARARRQAPNLPILVISGAMTDIPRDVDPLQSHTIFLRKPVAVGDLLTAIEQLLNLNMSSPETLCEC